MKFAGTAKGSHFGGAGIEQSEMTERASPLQQKAPWQPYQGAFVTVFLSGRGLHAKGIIHAARLGVYAKGIVHAAQLGVYAKGIIRAALLGVNAKVIVRAARLGSRGSICAARLGGGGRVCAARLGLAVYHRLQVFGLFPLGVKVYRSARCPVG